MDDFDYENNGEHWAVYDTGIYVKLPGFQYAYKTVLPREVFVEAYNRYIRDDTSSNSNKEFIG